MLGYPPSRVTSAVLADEPGLKISETREIRVNGSMACDVRGVDKSGRSILFEVMGNGDISLKEYRDTK